MTTARKRAGYSLLIHLMKEAKHSNDGTVTISLDKLESIWDYVKELANEPEMK